ncbi:hypothetical protein FIBSPDRAFT_933244 [Athelia psychrophila]|uniref:NYN domain-containing protein n=1 Tax=Athelia psychrophila TaxID=1759441 RepID=A0A166HH79_9AGAM|nr:hypothetical protein FIBSPDRAFT_933244 [Fibularhizoctonia sp. CBS 109695]
MSTKDSVAIFWDLDRVAPDSDSAYNDDFDAILSVAQRRGAVTLFKAYTDGRSSMEARFKLQSAGVIITGCQSDGFKSNMISVDMMSHSMDHAVHPVSIILISDDRELAYTISALLLHGIDVTVIAPGDTHLHLVASATRFIEWEEMQGTEPAVVPSIVAPSTREEEENASPRVPPLEELSPEDPSEDFALTASPAPSSVDTIVPSAPGILSNSESSPISFSESPAPEAGNPINGISLDPTPSTVLETDTPPFLQALHSHSALRAQNPTIYAHAGVTTFVQYASLAAQEGIVTIDQFRTATGTTSWLSLEPYLRPRPAPSGSPDTPPLSLQPNLPSIPAPHTSSDAMQSDFHSLIGMLRERGVGRIARKAAAIMLEARDPLAYSKATAKNATRYFKKAAKQGIIVLGEDPEHKWIELATAWRLPIDDEGPSRKPLEPAPPARPTILGGELSLFRELIEMLQNQPRYRMPINQARKALKDSHPDICARAGCKKMKAYVRLAMAKGVVTFFEQTTIDGPYRRYVQLNAPFQTPVNLPTPSLPLPASNHTVHPDVPPLSLKPNLSSIPVLNTSSDAVQSDFHSLVGILRERGVGRIECKAVATMLKVRDPLAYSKVPAMNEARNEANYFRKAAKQGIIILGEDRQSKWIELATTWRLPIDGEGPSREPPEPAPLARPTLFSGELSLFREFIEMLQNQPSFRMPINEARTALRDSPIDFCARAGCEKMKAYIRLAMTKGVVTFFEQTTIDGPYMRYVQLNATFQTPFNTSSSIDTSIDTTSNIHQLEASFESDFAPQVADSVVAAQMQTPSKFAAQASSSLDFKPLVQVLQRETSGLPFSWNISTAMKTVNPSTGYRGGLSWKNYIALAMDLGIVTTLPSGNINPFIALKVGWEKLLVPLDYATPTSTTPTILNQDQVHDVHTVARGEFSLLIEKLQEMRDNGVPRPYQSTVHAHVIDRKPSIYEDAGVESFAEYFDLAKDKGIVELGGTACEADGRAHCSVRKRQTYVHDFYLRIQFLPSAPKWLTLTAHLHLFEPFSTSHTLILAAFRWASEVPVVYSK